MNYNSNSLFSIVLASISSSLRKHTSKPFGKILICSLLIFPKILEAQYVNSWLTASDRSKLFQQQPVINMITSNPGGYTITIDTAIQNQIIDGFGFCLTEGSAEVISSLKPAKQDSLLRELFDPINGIGLSVLRISIGACDLNAYSYSYDEMPVGKNDVAMAQFSLAGPDLDYLIPILKKILLINPKIKLLGAPWSAPRWMKSSYTWVGGTLNPSYYQAYADYFVKYLDAMKSHGIDIWAITPQNEPENQKNEPSMTLTSAQEIAFINNNLGPTLRNAGYATKIIAFDHNCDNTAYPIDVCNQSQYVDGAAFHLYIGDISALTTVYKATNKNIYFTEQYTPTNSNFSEMLADHMNKVMLGSVNNWAKTAIEWNLATDAGFGPHTPGGCNTCMGAITVNNSTDFARNVSYYVAAHMSKCILPGAQRIGTSTTNNSPYNIAAFKNIDQSIALVIMNNGGTADIKVGIGNKYFNYTIPGYTVASFTMGGNQNSSIALSASAQINAEINTPLNLPVSVTGGAVSRLEFYNGGNLVQTDSTSPYLMTWAPAALAASVITIKAFDADGRYVSSLGVNLNVFRYKPIPATIQAEDYDNMSGIQTENCNDAGAGLNIGYLDTNDFIEYYVNAKYSGTYKVDFRVGSVSNGSFVLLEDGKAKSSINVSSTGGYQSWSTISNNIHLDAGNHILRLNISTPGWNLNYMVFTSLDSSGTDAVYTGSSEGSDILIYKNAGNDNLVSVKTNFSIQDKIVLSMSNCLGETMLTSEYNNQNKGSEMQLDMSKFPDGLYFLKVQIGTMDICKKIIKN